MKRGEIQFELQAPKVAFLSARKTLGKGRDTE